MKTSIGRCGIVLAAIAAVLATTQLAGAEPDRAADFGKLDSNGDGKVSLEEGRKKAGFELQFESLDRNHDGFLTLAEYREPVRPVDPATAPGGSANAQHMPRH